MATIAQYRQAKPLTAALLEWFGGFYLPDPTSPLASPLLAADRSGLPPATVIAAQIDVLQGQGKLYADALEAAGVDVQYSHFEGVTHEFFGMTMMVDKAADAVQEAADRLGASFEAPA